MAVEQNKCSFGSLTIEKGVGEDGEDESTDDGVLFYVNKSGFPIDGFTWERMWTHVSKLHPDGPSIEREIRGKKTLPEVAVPKPPVDFPAHFTTDEKVSAVQDYMNLLQLMESAKEMIREALPIKCLEAVILAVYLTNGMTSLDRFPVSFKTVFGGNTYRHVVCGLYSFGRYGAIGMSRRKDLMYKPLDYKCLSDLVLDYIAAYKRYFHDVKKVKVGLPIVHDAHSYEGITWKALTVTPKKQKRDEMCKEIDRHARDIKHLPRAFVETPRKSITVTKEHHKKHKKKSRSAKKASKDTPEATKMELPVAEKEEEAEEKQNPVISKNYHIRV